MYLPPLRFCQLCIFQCSQWSHTTGYSLPVLYVLVVLKCFSSGDNLHNVCHSWTSFSVNFTASENLTGVFILQEYGIKFLHMHKSKSAYKWVWTVGGCYEIWYLIWEPLGSTAHSLITWLKMQLFSLHVCCRDEFQVNLLNTPACNCALSSVCGNYFIIDQINLF